MCRPISGNLVRTKADYRVKPLMGSRGVKMGKTIALPRASRGLAEGQKKGDPNSFIILFEHERATIRAAMHHTQLKGVEA